MYCRALYISNRTNLLLNKNANQVIYNCVQFDKSKDIEKKNLSIY